MFEAFFEADYRAKYLLKFRKFPSKFSKFSKNLEDRKGGKLDLKSRAGTMRMRTRAHIISNL